MACFIVPDDDSGDIIAFDVIEAENHETVSEVTDHPVEQGVQVTDHVRPTPDHVSFIGITTNHPIQPNPFTQRGEYKSFKLDIPKWEPPIEATPGSLYRQAINSVGELFASDMDVGVTVLTFDEPFDAIRETHEALLDIQVNAVPVSIFTSLREYEDMVITRVAAPRNAGREAVAFGIDARELRIVQTGEVAAPPVPADNVPGGKPLINKGAQVPKPPRVSESTERPDSLAKQLLSSQGISVKDLFK